VRNGLHSILHQYFPAASVNGRCTLCNAQVSILWIKSTHPYTDDLIGWVCAEGIKPADVKQTMEARPSAGITFLVRVSQKVRLMEPVSPILLSQRQLRSDYRDPSPLLTKGA
jgi:hypothetical protein